MLFVFHLDWNHFSIADVVVEGNQFLEKMTNDLGVSERVIFNCASMGAGEWVQGNKKNKDTGLVPEGVPADVLSYLRWHHRQVKTAIQQSEHFVANRDMTEMLKTLRSRGHDLAVVGTTRTDAIESALKETRTRDYFDTNVFGYDKCADGLRGNFTLAALYTTAIDANDANYEDVLVVADDADAIQDAVPLQTCAIVGYLDPYVDWNEQTIRLKEMEEAGARYTAIGGHTVSALPLFLKGQADHSAKVDISQILAKDKSFGQFMQRSLGS